VLRVVNNVLADHNIEKQFSDSKGDIAYLMADISGVGQEEVKDIYQNINGSHACILTRLLCKFDPLYRGDGRCLFREARG
jgi:D-3-phosphoglycerate dehydrogenase